jgi:hypothetical protein
MIPKLISKNFIDSDKAKCLADDIKNNKNLWLNIDNWYPELKFNPFYTIGSPLYTERDLAWYKDMRNLSDDFLNRHAWLLESVIKQLELYYNKPWKKKPNGSLPGFQIFNTNNRQANNEYREENYHIDIDWLTCFPEEGYTVDDINSFLLILEIPENGTGLDWLDNYGNPQHTEYELYGLYLFPAKLQHKISNMVLKSDNSYRITYQGFGLFNREEQTFYYFF